MAEVRVEGSGPRSIAHLLTDRARRSADRTFLRWGDTSLTFGEVDRRSAQVANRLAELGVAPGDRVGVMLPNGMPYPLVWLGIVRLGAVVVPINTGYQDADLGHVLADSGAATVLTINTLVPLVDRVTRGMATVERVLVWDGMSSVKGGNPQARLPFEEQIGFVADHLDPGTLTRGTLCALQYTSGTTGFPKGCMMTHGSWLRAAETVAGLDRFSEDDVVAIMTAFYYGDFGWNLVMTLLVGTELVMLPRFSASTLWTSLAESGATFFYCLGAMPGLLLKQPPAPARDRAHRVRWVACSGIPADEHRTLEERWGVPWRELYGTTEIGFVLGTGLEDRDRTGTGSIGRLLPGYDARLIDADGREVAEGDVGQFICRGPGMCLGYWNNPEATADWMRDGWAHTGDLMRRDRDGHFHLVGRTRDMIRRGGENVAAAEVEAVLRTFPAVINAACLAVPDPLRGEEIKAVLQIAGDGPAPEPEAILAHCRGQLAAFKVPRYLSFVKELPLTPSQRVEKHRLARDASGCYDATARAWR